MSKALFINGTAHGHLNPTFPVVRELAARGEEVYYCSTGDFKRQIECAGAIFIDCGEDLDARLRAFRPTGNHPFYTLIEFLLYQDIVMSRIILDRTRRMDFDYIVHDAMLGGGSIVARVLGIPAACTCASFAFPHPPVPPAALEHGAHPQLDAICRQAEEFRKQSGIPLDIMDIFFQREKMNIVFTSRMFQPGGDGFDDTFRFVGPSIDDRREEETEFPSDFIGGKLVYISMGTINNNCIDFYMACMEAFKGVDATVVMSVGKKVDIGTLGPIPRNFIVRSWAPQLTVLKKASAFVSHGGLNSVSEALYFGVPLVVIPQGNDQPMVAQRVSALGAGIQLKMEDITPDLLLHALCSVMEDAAYRQAGSAIGRSFAESGGYRKAADDIIELSSGI